MQDEPEWIEWGPDSPGYPKCPVPDGHVVEVWFDTGVTKRVFDPEVLCWCRSHKLMSPQIVRYRDWTAFEQAKDTPPAEQVPSDEACVRAYDMWHMGGSEIRDAKVSLVRRSATRLAIARLIEQHLPRPLDPLREIANEMWPYASGGGRKDCVDRMAEVLRARLPQAALDALKEG